MFIITSGWLILVNYANFEEVGERLQAFFFLFPAEATKITPCNVRGEHNYNYN